MNPLLLFVGASAAFVLGAGASPEAKTAKTSGVYLSAAEYKNNHLSYEGDCGSKTHKLELHDVLNKPYIDVTHESEKRRYFKSDLFGFRACDGRDYRFASNLAYQILETRGLYIYVREVKTHGKGFYTELKYYFSAGPDGPILALTRENLRKALLGNRKFLDSLDAAFAPRQNIAEYDNVHGMFRVNQAFIASREP